MDTLSKVRPWTKTAWKVAVLVALVALGLGTASYFSIDRTRRLIREIEALNGQARTAYNLNTFIPGLRLRFGDLRDVSFLGPQVDDGKLAILGRAPRLRVLTLINTRVTDEGLSRLEKLRDLNFVILASLDLAKTNGPSGARLTTPPLTGGKGLGALEDLPELTRIRLIGPGTSDADLKGLARLKHLLLLELMETRVTDEGVAEFKKARPGCVILRK